MNNVQNSPAEARLERLGKLIQLQFEARHAATLDELLFHMVNNTHHVVPYRQAAVWSKEGGKKGRIVAVSGLPRFDVNAPYIVWLSKVLAHVAASDALVAKAFSAEDLPLNLRAQWSEWLATNAVWIPLFASKGGALGGMFLSCDAPWSADDEYLVAQISDAYSVAWVSFIARRPLLGSIGRRIFNRKLAWAVLIGIVGVMFMPVNQTVLAPAEVIATAPALVRTRMQGIIERIYVKPNEAVKKGQVIFELEASDLANRLRVVELNLKISQAEYRQNVTRALYDTKSKGRLQVLKGKIESQTAKVKRVRDQLKQIQVRASRSGVAIFTDVNDWIGRPVVAGEKIMQIVDPSMVELEIFLPVSDAINFKPDAKTIFFLNINPERPLSALIRSSSFRASVTPEGVLAYRVKAAFDDDGVPPRIGLRGTAKIYGRETSLFYFLFRRPLAKARQWFGW